MAFIHRVGLLLVFFLLPLTGLAQTVYIDDKITVGLHQDKDIDSPITKTLPSGTALEVLKRDTPLTQVQEPGGTSGWIDNRYLTDAAPGRSQLMQLQEKAGKLESELSLLKADSQNTAPAPGADTQQLAALLKENEELKQQLQSEQLKSGELQARAAELRNQLSQASNQDRSAESEEQETESAADSLTARLMDKFSFSGSLNWHVFLAALAACLVIGLIGGAFIMDWRSRRRHGGFRI